MKGYDEKLINAFVISYKPSVIQKTAGISKTRYYNLKANQEFMAAVQERRDLLVKEAVLRMESYLCEDIEILQEIIRKEETAPQVKINAIQLIMNQLGQWKGITELTERIAALENTEGHRKTG